MQRRYGHHRLPSNWNCHGLEAWELPPEGQSAWLAQVNDVRPAPDATGVWIFAFALDERVDVLFEDELRWSRSHAARLRLDHAGDAVVYWVSLTPVGLNRDWQGSIRRLGASVGPWRLGLRHSRDSGQATRGSASADCVSCVAADKRTPRTTDLQFGAEWRRLREPSWIGIPSLGRQPSRLGRERADRERAPRERSDAVLEGVTVGRGGRNLPTTLRHFPI